FDRVFKPSTTQREVYRAVEHVAHGISSGFNGTIMAYGQTGSGKTHTMREAQEEDEVEEGIIFRAVSTILQGAERRMAMGWDCVVMASYVEIYNERVRDLLDPKNDNLRVVEHPGRGAGPAGVREQHVTCLSDAEGLLREGARHRATAPTLMNRDSSRSHSIFTLRLDQVQCTVHCFPPVTCSRAATRPVLYLSSFHASSIASPSEAPCPGAALPRPSLVSMSSAPAGEVCCPMSRRACDVCSAS
ncbi:unnamed protein product, partial [Discosporangium mesarthrocarpum]